MKTGLMHVEDGGTMYSIADFLLAIEVTKNRQLVKVGIALYRVLVKLIAEVSKPFRFSRNV